MPRYLVALEVELPPAYLEEFPHFTPEKWGWDALVNPGNTCTEAITPTKLLRVQEILENEDAYLPSGT